MQNDQLMLALNDLDQILRQDGVRIRIVICGAYAIQLHGFNRVERTIDVDSILKIDDAVIQYISKVGKRFGLKDTWLNDQAASVAIPDGAFARAKPFGTWKNIEATLIAREDLIKMKASAFSIRREETEKDWDDLLLLKPSKKEIEDAILFLKATNTPPKNATKKIIEEHEETINDLRTLAK